MQTFPLTDGSRMALVVGQIRTPCGRVIQRDYHNETRRAYYRDAGEAPDNSNRPSCKTDAGRTVFGGGGIVPDVFLPRGDAPVWISRIDERGLLLSWSSGFATKTTASLTTVDALAKSSIVDAAAITDFRSYASSSGISIPTGGANDDAIARAILRSVALAKFGPQGYYQLPALTDPSVKTAVESFSRASQLLGTSKH